jgi:DNA segregation ATPase FtsK/SpoIIIE-like protein
MLAVFRQLLAMVKDRNLNSRTQPNPPGVLLILEEYQDIRAAADDDKARKVLDAELGRIVRMGRAVGFHILISTQRPSVEDFPSGQRNLINQRACLMTRNGQDAALVLGHTPTLPLPARRGDAIVALPDRDCAATIDYLNDSDWQTLCDRAANLRRVDTNEPVAADEPEAEPSPPSPLEAAVVDILSHSGRLTPAMLLYHLQSTGVETNATALGRALDGMAGVERGRDGAGRFVRLNGSGRRETALRT